MLSIETLIDKGRLQWFEPGAYIIREKDNDCAMYILLSGKVGIFVNSFTESPIKVGMLEAGDIIGEMSLFDGLPRSASVIAAEQTAAFRIDKDNIEYLFTNRTDVVCNIIKSLSQRIRTLNVELAKNVINKEEVCVAWPDNHKKYNLYEPETYQNFVSDTEVRCPICDNHFKTKSLLSELSAKLISVDDDFRKIYLNFDPLWYSVIVCPDCNYSNLYNEFQIIPKKTIKLLRINHYSPNKSQQHTYTSPRSIDQVFSAYYHALNTAKECNATFSKFAFLWLQLSWLYKDVNDHEMYHFASLKALENFKEELATNHGLQPVQKQQYLLIAAELSIKLNRDKAAEEFLIKAANITNGLSQYSYTAISRMRTVL